MPELSLLLSAVTAILWIATVCLPWLPWANREVLETDQDNEVLTELDDITVVIPARNEARVIETTLLALTKQGPGLKIIVVDDESTDGTADVIRQLSLNNLSVIRSKPLPEGWTGKLWAQQQGLLAVQTEKTLLLDADIELLPGIVKGLKRKMQTDGLQFISLMAQLRFSSFWEKLLMPAFIYFFKMLYPFALANNAGCKTAAAAGGCILVETACLHRIGTMAAIKSAVIDDCSLAKKIKAAGYKTWIGLTHGAVSQRPYVSLNEIWEMVARTAYSQLFYSIVLLMLCTMTLILMYGVPVVGMFCFSGLALNLSLLAALIMTAVYIPTLRFYSLSPVWSLAMPIIASLYLLMTWTSAWRFWNGERSRWKGRIYQNS